MSETEPLDLSWVDPPIWRVLVSDTIYGPYTLGQIRSFILQGRILPLSEIAEGEEAPFQQAFKFEKLTAAFAEQAERNTAEAFSNFVVITQLETSRDAFVDALNLTGSFGEAMPGVYLLRSSMKLSQIRTRLADAILDSEKVMIVDATNDRLAWSGLGTDADTHLKALWKHAA